MGKNTERSLTLGGVMILLIVMAFGTGYGYGGKDKPVVTKPGGTKVGGMVRYVDLDNHVACYKTADDIVLGCAYLLHQPVQDAVTGLRSKAGLQRFFQMLEGE